MYTSCCLLGILKELLGTFQKPSTPLRPHSPFKRHCKVAPMSSPSAEDEGQLQERTTSPVIPFRLEDYAEDVSSRVTSFEGSSSGMPGDATVLPGDATVITNVQVAGEQVTTPLQRETPLSMPHGSATKEAGMGAKSTVTVDVEPLYSPVLKTKRKELPSAPSDQRKAIDGAAVAGCEFASNPSASDSPSPTHLEAESPQGGPPVAKITPVSTPVDDLRPHVKAAFGGNASHYESLDDIDPDNVAERSRRVYVEASSGSDEERESGAVTGAQVTSRGKEKSSSSGQRVQKKGKSKASNFDDAPALLLDSLATDMHVLHYAAIKGNKKEMTEILAKMKVDGVSVDLKDSEGRTALMHAVHCEHAPCIKLLVDHGANINLAAFGEQVAILHGFTCVLLWLALPQPFRDMMYCGMGTDYCMHSPPLFGILSIYVFSMYMCMYVN